MIRHIGRYIISAYLHGGQGHFYAGYKMRTPDGYPTAYVGLEAWQAGAGKETLVPAMKRVALRDDWEDYGLNDPTSLFGVRREKGLASLLPEEDHVAAVKHFFAESIRQLREELTAFKKERPDLPGPVDDPFRSACQGSPEKLL